MVEQSAGIALVGVTLTDATTGAAVELGALTGVRVLSLVRHRY